MSRTAADEGRLVYVGNLAEDVRERDLGDLFDKYGKIVHIEIKIPARPPNFAFIEYGDWRDAEDAVRGRDGRELLGARMRVEIARGRDRRERDRFQDRRGPPQTTGFRVVVRGLPPNVSWQDLKDYFRKAAPPAYTDVKRSRDGPLGIVEFETGADMDRAIRDLDGSEFRNSFGSGMIKVMEDKLGPPQRGRGPPPRGRFRSRSPPRRRPQSYSPRGRRGDSRSPSPRGRPASRSVSPRRSPSPRGRSRSVSRSPPRDYSPRADDRYEGRED